uniref:Protein kinase domain-containing protein n=1 Tax=Gibberella zeae TaxID=5518 RepID=A0A4E9EDT5_GIBZA
MPGTRIIAKHINIAKVVKEEIPGSVFLEPLVKEALILSNTHIRGCVNIPELIGISSETYSQDGRGNRQQYPYLLMELGENGNLEDWIRHLWRLAAPGKDYDMTSGFQPTSRPNWKIRIPWDIKIDTAASVAVALGALHTCGVIHGDVKMANIICNAATGVQHLCDFGSSILLSDHPRGTKTRLISRSPPWDAPESTTEIEREELNKTDIYSFGLLFARLILEGNDPFDEYFHICEPLRRRNDVEFNSFVTELKMEDLVIDRVMRRLQADNVYDEGQLAFIQTVLDATLHKSPHMRVQSIRSLIDFLERARETEDLTKIGPLNTALRDHTYPISENNEEYLFVRRGSKILLQNITKETTPLGSRLLGPKGVGIAAYISETSESTFKPPNLSYESFNDPISTRHFDGNGVPNLSLCDLHGWGTVRSKSNFLKMYKKACLARCGHALQLLHPLSCALECSILDPSIEEEKLAMIHAEQVVLRAVSQWPDMRTLVWVRNAMPQVYKDAIINIKSKTRPIVLERIINKVINTHAAEEITTLNHNLADIIGPRLWFSSLLQGAAALGDSNAVEYFVQKLGEVTGSRISQSIHVHKALLQACVHGHAFIAIYLLEQGADPNIVGPNLRSPFHYLDRFESDMVKNVATMLIHNGGRVNILDEDGLSPLSFILSDEHNTLPEPACIAIDWLLQNDAEWYDKSQFSSNTLPSKTTPLVRAALSTRVDFIQLIQTKVAREFWDALSGGSTKSRGGLHDHEAYQRVCLEALRYLCEQPLITRLHQKGAHGEAFDLSQLLDLYLSMSQLSGSSVLKYITEERAFDLLESLGSSFPWPVDDIRPVLNAAKTRDFDVVRVLFQKGTKFEVTDQNGRNMFYHAVVDCWSVADLQAICSDHQHIVDLHAMVNDNCGPGGSNSFDFAVCTGSFDLADFFIKLGADTSSAHLFLDDIPEPKSEISILGYVLSRNFINPNNLDPETKDPFDGVMTTFEMLFEHYSQDAQALLQAPDALGNTALHYAAVSGNLRGVERLIADLDVNINARALHGATPWDYAQSRVPLILKGKEKLKESLSWWEGGEIGDGKFLAPGISDEEGKAVLDFFASLDLGPPRSEKGRQQVQSKIDCGESGSTKHTSPSPDLEYASNIRPSTSVPHEHRLGSSPLDLEKDKGVIEDLRLEDAELYLQIAIVRYLRNAGGLSSVELENDHPLERPEPGTAQWEKLQKFKTLAPSDLFDDDGELRRPTKIRCYNCY